MENVASNAGGGLVRAEDFDRPIGSGVEAIDDIARIVEGDAFPAKDGNIGHDRAVAEGTAQFGEGEGNFVRLGNGMNSNNEFLLDAAVATLRHGFADDLPVDIFAGGFGFGLNEEFVEGGG